MIDAHIEMTDKTGQMRAPDAFAEARRVVTARIVKGGIPQDVELFMQYTTIIEALQIAEIVSRAREKRT
jgi:hypothetical protein